MSHKDAPPLTPEQERFEAWVRERKISVGLGREKSGRYFAPIANELWGAWQAGAAVPADDAPVPRAWYRLHRQPAFPGAPDNDECECYVGDEPPDDRAEWMPLYTAPPPPEPASASLDALRRFAAIKANDGDHFDSYPDDCVIRCEVTVGDIKAARRALADAERTDCQHCGGHPGGVDGKGTPCPACGTPRATVQPAEGAKP